MDTKEKERTRRTQSRKAASASPSGTRSRAAVGRQVTGTVKKTPQTKKTAPKGNDPARQETRAVQRPSSATTKRSEVKERAAAQTRRPSQSRKTKKRSIAEDVVYLPPKPFSRNRLLLRLATVVAVVLALVLGISVFFKVDQVIVSGNLKYSPEAILEASGIQIGDNLLTFSRAKAGGKIVGTLPFVENVRFGIKLPGTVNIEITEVEVSYAAVDAEGIWWLISASGKILEQLPSGANTGYTNVLGVKLDAPVAGTQAVALEEQQPETDEAGNLIPVTVTAEKRLNTALNILQYLEQNGIIGEAASVDVTELGDIYMQYGRRYQVKLGDDTQLGYKISFLKAAVDKVSKEYPYSVGTLDISNPEEIRYDQENS